MAGVRELIAGAFAAVASDDEVDMVSAMADPSPTGIIGLLAPDAEIRFLPLDDEGLAKRESAFKGREGYLAGWLEWLEPYESFRARLLQLTEIDERTALLEIEAKALLRGSGIEVVVEAAAIYRFAGERISSADHYLSLDQARREAGVA